MAKYPKTGNTKPLLSLNAYARARGVNPTTIWKAVQDGRLRALDGKIDPVEPDATWYRRYLQRNDGYRSGAASEARREAALSQTVAAKLIITRHKAELLRDALVDRDSNQAEVSRAVLNVAARLMGAAFDQEIVKVIETDLGHLQVEALKVTR